MKKNIVFILTVLVLMTVSVFAQKNKIKFNSINTFELISGQSPSSFGFQTVNGIRFSNWYSGIGIGVDKYKYKTLPLFVDVRKFFGAEKKAFVYGDIGYNFPMKNKPEKEIYYYRSYHFTGGIYTDIGMGYQFHLYKNNSLLFGLGYSYKKLESKIGGVVNYCPNIGCPVDYSKYEFSYGRIILKAGMVF